MPEGYKAPTQPLSPEEVEALKALGMEEDDTEANFAFRTVDDMSLDDLAATWRGLMRDAKRFPQLLAADADLEREQDVVAVKSDDSIHTELAQHYQSLQDLDGHTQLDYWLANRATIQALIEAVEEHNRIGDALARGE
jgi:hypothetical protein